MRLLILAAASALALNATAESMQILSPGNQNSMTGPEQWFSGAVQIEPLFSGRETPPADMGAASVEFAAGARTAWHSHSKGQLLIITEGEGWVQERGGDKMTVNSGELVWIPPGVEHWHGATADSAMTHTAIQQAGVDWGDPVSDDTYND